MIMMLCGGGVHFSQLNSGLEVEVARPRTGASASTGGCAPVQPPIGATAAGLNVTIETLNILIFSPKGKAFCCLTFQQCFRVWLPCEL